MDKQEIKQLNVFGYGLPLILGFFAVRHFMKAGADALSIALIVLAAGMLGITICSRPLLIVIFRYWMRAVGLIGACVTAGLLTVLYYGVFTPIAMVLRLRGKDFMGNKGQGSSFWKKKEDQRVLKERYQQQY